MKRGAASRTSASCVYRVCAAAVRDHVLACPRILDRVRGVFTLGFAGFGTRLAVESR